MNHLKMIKRYFKITNISLKDTLWLMITALLSDGPYMLTSLIFSYVIKYLTDKNIHQVCTMLMIYFSLKIISKIARILNYRAEKHFYNQVYYKLQNTLIDKFKELEVDYFTNERKSQTLNIANGDIKTLADFGTWLTNALVLLISFIISTLILWKISFYLMLFGIVVNTIVILILNHYNDLYEKIMNDTKIKTDQEMGFFSQLMNGFTEIKIFNILENLRKRYLAYNEAYIQEHNLQINNNIIKNIISPTITMIAEMILMIYSVYYCMQGKFGIETVLIIQSYFGNLFSALSNLISSLGELRIIHVSIERYETFIYHQCQQNPFGNDIIKSIDGQIEFVNVSFDYASHPVIKNFSAVIPPHSLTAVIGQSGSGKTTLMNLLLRFIHIKEGHINIDHHDITTLSSLHFYEYISIVKQDPFIFNLSIYDNLAMIDPDFNHIQKVCRQVHLHDYIMSLPQQYQTILNEDATDLSGGQKQRLAIARVLLKKTKIIIFDEMTSALDEDLSNSIFELVNELKKEHTILLITHKADEYLRCDHVIDLSI